MKRQVLVLFLVMILLVGCSPDTNGVDQEFSFAAIVEEVNVDSILVRVNEDEDEFKSSDLISLALDAELKASIANLSVGDEVEISYDGIIAESYPAQIHNVYAISLMEQ